MTEVVIDTNVLLVAAGKHEGSSDPCVLTCVKRLQEIKQSGTTVVIDDRYRILSEYQHKLEGNSGKKDGGTVFLKWLLQQQTNRKHVTQVSITETAAYSFVEFPIRELEPEFDPPDRIFPAVANAHRAKPPILQATDCKWLRWWGRLAEAGIYVEFICPDDVCRFYHNKYPDEAVPALP